MTPSPLRRNQFRTMLIAIALCSFQLSAHADDTSSNESPKKVHPIGETKKAAKAVGHGVKKTTKAVGHGFRDGARAVGHGTRNVTRGVGHAFRDTAHEVTGKETKKE
jgi:hypothetical protein